MVIYVNGALSLSLSMNLIIVKLSSDTYIGDPIERMQLINDLNVDTFH